MLAFLRFEGRRIFGERKNLVFLGFIALSSAYLAWSGLNEYRSFLEGKKAFINFEKEKTSQISTYAQYGVFGFRLLVEASPLSLFFVNCSVVQDLESNIDNFEAIRVESSFKGNKLFMKRGYFKDFAGVVFVFGSLLMLYLGHLALVSPAYVRFMTNRMSLGKFYCMTTLARLSWLNLYFLALAASLYFLIRLTGVAFSISDRRTFLLYLAFLILMLDFFYLLGQMTTVLVRFRRVSFFWFFVVWFVCVFLLPEISRISVFNRSQALDSAEKVNLEKFRNLMAMEKRFGDFLKVNPSTPMDQVRQMQKKFAIQFINSSFLVNTALETRYLREVEEVIAGHERQSVLFPTTFYHFLTGEASGKGYYGYIAFMDYIMKLRSRFIQFYLKKRYEESDPPMESFVKLEENVFRSPSQPPKSYWWGFWATVMYGSVIAILTFRRLSRLVYLP